MQFAGLRLQVLSGPARRSDARSRVEVHERLDGSLAVFTTDGVCVATQPAPLEAPLLRARNLARPPRQAAPSAPAATPETLAPVAPPTTPKRPHPWTQSYKGRRPDQHDLMTTNTWLKRPKRTDSPAI